MSITLNEKEREIFNFLLSICPEGTILRAAGGYIRDRLLGMESHDIDIAISNMSGKDFANLVVEKLGEKSVANIIEARPDQSKHLETAMVDMFELTIDFVNLRKESYGESRIPTIEFGTPEEDANRRDLTINALFYNLHTGEIEDFTGKGLDDLKNKIARTPIDPVQTFLDDPLRILRCVRFAAKYKLSIHYSIRDIFCDSPLKYRESIKEAFKNKISKERIWSELIGQEEKYGWKAGMLTGPDPFTAISILADLDLIELLFTPEGFELNAWETDQCSIHHDLNILDHTMEVLDELLKNKKDCTPQDFAVRVLTVIYHDIGKCDPKWIQQHPDGIHLQYKKHEIGSGDLAEIALSQKLNAPIEIKNRVVKLVREHMRLHHMDEIPTDKALRHFIKDVGEDWEHSVDIAIADTNGKLNKIEGAHLKYERYRERIKGLLLAQGGATKPKRPINGNEVQVLLDIRPSKIIGQLFEILDDVLLENPNLSRAECFEIVKNAYSPI